MANQQQKEIIIDLGLKRNLDINPPEHIWGYVGKMIKEYGFETVKKVTTAINAKVTTSYFVGAVRNEFLKNTKYNNKYTKKFEENWTL